MNVVHEDVEKLVDKELEAATERFGLHHSWHEKYAVTLEDLQECEEVVRWMRTFLDEAFDCIRKNSQNAAYDTFYTVYNHAVRCAVEAIQVAAMCKKEISERADNGTAKISDHGVYSGKDPVRIFHCHACRSNFVSTNLPYPHFCPKCGADFSGTEFTNVLRF